jgi:hypothetical protein
MSAHFFNFKVLKTILTTSGLSRLVHSANLGLLMDPEKGVARGFASA